MHNTGNPIPSAALEDMADNAQTFDALVTKTEGTITDRLGRTRPVFQQILMDMGFKPLAGSFQTGATITARNQTLYDEVSHVFYSWGGTIPKVVSAGSTPATSGGVGVGAWVDRTNSSLRQSLISGCFRQSLHGNDVLELADLISLREFGITGSGDETTKWQLYFDYCVNNYKDIVIPSKDSGTYDISSPLIYRNNGSFAPKIIGIGGNVVFNLTSTATSGLPPDAYGVAANVNAAIIVYSSPKQHKGCDIRGIRFQTTVNADYAVYVTTTEHAHFEDCFATGFKYGVYDMASWVLTVDRFIARNVTETGFHKVDGTSSHFNHCYVDHAKRGFNLTGGYSGLHNCACDYSTDYGFVFNAPASLTSDVTFNVSNCGSENSGSGAVFQVNGGANLTVDTHTAFNYSAQQSPTPAALLEINSDYTQVVFRNVRYLGVAAEIVDNGNHNDITFDHVTSRSPVTKYNPLGVNSHVFRVDESVGVQHVRGASPAGIGFLNEDIYDGDTNITRCGIRNKQVIARVFTSVTRTSGKSYGSATVTLPYKLSAFSVSPSIISQQAALTDYKPIVSIANKTTTTFDVVVDSANSSTIWNNFSVEFIVFGVKV